MTNRSAPVVDVPTDVNDWLDGHGEGGLSFVDKAWRKSIDRQRGALMFAFPFRSPKPVRRYLHTFPVIVEKGRKDNKPYLGKGKSWVSPDPEIICKYPKLEEDGRGGFTLEKPGIADPFLLLLPILRTKIQRGDIHPEQVVFAWTDPNPDPGEPHRIEWRAKFLANMVEKSHMSRGERDQTLMPRGQFIYGIIVLSQAGTVRVLEVPWSAGDSIYKEIQRNVSAHGDRGNPFKTPLACVLEFDGTQSGTGMYKFKIDALQELSPTAIQSIQTLAAPDVTHLGRPRRGDKSKLRLAMQAAATEANAYHLIPWDEIFNDAWKDEDPTEFPPRDAEFSTGGPSNETRQDVRSGVISERRDPPVSPPPAPATSQPSTPPPPPAAVPGAARTPTASSTASMPARRVAAPPPPPTTLPVYNGEIAIRPDQVVACVDACQLRQHPGWKRCPSCGTNFDPMPGFPAIEPFPMAWLVEHRWPGAVATNPTSQASLAAAVTSQPAASPPAVPAPDQAPQFATTSNQCVSCRFEMPADADRCPRCQTSVEVDLSGFLS
jgi:hypothetical protein